MKIVFISGGFDPIHVGHIRYINEARKLGDRLIAILNSDKFLNDKKGYIFMPYGERKEILINIRNVDLVIPCIDEDLTICKTLSLLRLNPKLNDCELIFAKGGDRTIDNIPEAAICNKHNIKMVFGVGGDKVQSSSSLVKEVKCFQKSPEIF